MRILNENDYQIINLNHPRYKNIEIIQFDNQTWISLNDLCKSVKTTTASALSSIKEHSEYVNYIAKGINCKDFHPFVTPEGFLLADIERTPSYKRHILNWLHNELQEPQLPTINQMVVLASNDPDKETELDYQLIQQHLNKLHTQIAKYSTLKTQHLPQSSDFEPYNHDCNITQLIQLYKENGLILTAQDLVTWLILKEYICFSQKKRYRPYLRYYDRGYFVDNRKTFNSFYPQRDLLFTPYGQQYFFERLSVTQNN